ncbi:MAG: hypothetical protein WEB52_00320 [Dehalococcoidia bacterium]
MGEPRTLADLIDEVRKGLICDRCGRYVGSLAEKTYLPPAYAVAVSKDRLDDEVGALIAFERHIIERLRRGNFVIRHPQKDGRCVSIQEWLADDDEEEDDEDSAAAVSE